MIPLYLVKGRSYASANCFTKYQEKFNISACAHTHTRLTALFQGLPGTHTHTHTRLTALFQGLPGWAGTSKVKPMWILLKQETVSGSGIRWDICKSAPHSRQITMPAPHHSVSHRTDAFPAAQPTASKHWRGAISDKTTTVYNNDNNNDRLTAFDPGQPG